MQPDYNNFRRSLEFTLKWEGGYVNDPNDPGGETNYGISKRYHPNEDIKNITPERVSEIYYHEYWTPSGCDTLTFPLCVVIFDSAVNLGVGRAVSFCKSSDRDWSQAIQQRKNYYAGLVKANPAKQRYLAGWLNRCNDLDKYCQLAE